MNCRTKSPPPPRQAVLVVSHPDGYVEAFAERNIDVHLARVPVAHTREGERVTDDVLELSLPRRYRSLWRRDRLRANGTTRPLTPNAIARSLATRDALTALNRLADESAVEEGGLLWTL